MIQIENDIKIFVHIDKIILNQENHLIEGEVDEVSEINSKLSQ